MNGIPRIVMNLTYMHVYIHMELDAYKIIFCIIILVPKKTSLNLWLLPLNKDKYEFMFINKNCCHSGNIALCIGHEQIIRF